MTPGRGGQPIDHLRVENVTPGVWHVTILTIWQRHLKDHRAPRFEPDLRIAQVQETTAEQARRNEQDEGGRHLEGDEAVLRTPPCATRRHPRCAQTVEQLGHSRTRQPDEPDRGADQRRTREHERGGFPSERHLVKTWDLALGEAEFRGQCERGDGKRDNRRREAEHHSFHHEPLRERDASCAERERDGNLVAGALGAEQEEVDHVRRRNEQHGCDQDTEQDELRAHRSHGGRLERHDRYARSAALEHVGCDRREARRQGRNQRVQLGLGRGWADALAQATDHVETTRGDLGRFDGHRRGIEDIHRRLRKIEGAREDAHDGARPPFVVDAAPDDGRICAVAAAPEALRDEDREHALAIPRGVAGLEEPAEKRARA